MGLLNILLMRTKYYLRSTLRISCVNVSGVKLQLTKGMSKKLVNRFYSESYELDEIRILQKKISNRDTVLEVGAGIGFLSIFAAKIVGSKRVFAYEANPDLIDIIKNNYKLNKVSPTIENCILSNVETKKALFFVEGDFYSSSTIQRSDTARRVEVSVSSLNRVLEKVAPSFLIVDIEGGEDEFFQNIELSSVNKILVETHPNLISFERINNIITRLISWNFFLDTQLSRNSVLFFERRLKSS